MATVTVGVDIGQKVDPTAIAVIETETRPVPGALPAVYHLTRHLERLELGTPYPAVAQRIQAIVTGIQRRLGTSAPLQETRGVNPHTGAGTIQRTRILPLVRCYLDGTGVGQPVLDLMTAAGMQVRGVYFSHGDRRVVQANGSISLGKAWLVSRLQALLQTGRILLPNTPEAQALAKELRDYEIRVSEDAQDRYGAFRVGAHDDLVTALGLATQDDGPLGFAPAVGAPRPALPKGVLG